jgi:hypothetical protein
LRKLSNTAAFTQTMVINADLTSNIVRVGLNLTMSTIYPPSAPEIATKRL